LVKRIYRGKYCGRCGSPCRCHFAE
jgi:hypothetical protein